MKMKLGWDGFVAASTAQARREISPNMSAAARANLVIDLVNIGNVEEAVSVSGSRGFRFIRRPRSRSPQIQDRAPFLEHGDEGFVSFAANDLNAGITAPGGEVEFAQKKGDADNP